MTLSNSMLNRLGFIVLGLTNNFGYVIMISAAYDLLKSVSHDNNPTTSLATNNTTNNGTQNYCNDHSTATILLADTLPSLTTKIFYPFLLVRLATSHKAIGVAAFAAASFLTTGLSSTEVLIFFGVILASLSSGLGEPTYLSSTPIYGDAALSGWSIGTGAAGLVGAGVYFLLKLFLSIKVIMLIMLIVPIAMLLAFFLMIRPIDETNNQDNQTTRPSGDNVDLSSTGALGGSASQVKDYGTGGTRDQSVTNQSDLKCALTFKDKLNLLPSLAKYFMPLWLVYLTEYFINQGLFELIYYPEIKDQLSLDKSAQYRWFQLSYQLGVFISRSSLDMFQIKYIWTMSILQLINAVIFTGHVAKLFYLPSFYLVTALIVYEGLLGGFTYVNAFYRIKKEVPRDQQEYSISVVTIADSIGIVMAGLLALPAHKNLCKIYQNVLI